MTQRTWRILFDLINWQILAPLSAGRTVGAISIEQQADLATVGLTDAARVLLVAEIASGDEVDVMWRYWGQLVGLDRRRGSRRTGQRTPTPNSASVVLDRLAEIHQQLTVVVMANLLRHMVTRSQAEGDEQREAQVAFARRVQTRLREDLPDGRDLQRVVGAMFESREDGSFTAEKIWDHYATSVIPERLTTFVESLQTGLIRLQVAHILVSGQSSSAADWTRSVSDEELNSTARPLIEVASRYWVSMAMPPERVVGEFGSVTLR
jgi:hypothetical protein